MLMMAIKCRKLAVPHEHVTRGEVDTPWEYLRIESGYDFGSAMEGEALTYISFPQAGKV